MSQSQPGDKDPAAGTSPWHQQRTLLPQVQPIQLNCFSKKKSAEDGFCTAGPWIFHVPSTSSQGPPHAEFSARNPSHLPLQVRRFEGISRLSQDLRTDGNGVVAHCLSTVDSKSRGEGSGGRISCSPTTSSKVGYKTHPVRMGVWGCCS